MKQMHDHIFLFDENIDNVFLHDENIDNVFLHDKGVYMNKQIKNYTLTITMALFLITFFLINLIKPDKLYSDSERRTLSMQPKFTTKSYLSRQFMKDFESYSQDQFVLRDTFRSVKSISEFYVFHKKENNGYYIADGYLAKLEYPENEAMISHATDRFTYIYNAYLKDLSITPYFVMIPDKSFFLAKENGYPSLDYKAFETTLKTSLPFMQFIDIKPLLSIDDYYKTDTHWRQERIEDVAKLIASRLGADIASSYEYNTLAKPFYGVYYNQVALFTSPDTLHYITNDTINSCIVTNQDTGKPVPSNVYNMDKANDKDSYEMFLDGSVALITIENPHAKSNKQLILFRDSFASSLAPYFIEGYQKITLVDIRYVQSTMLGYFLDFDNADVVFLYSTLLLNNSLSLK